MPTAKIATPTIVPKAFTARLDRGGPKERADQGRQKVVALADAGLADAQLAGQHDPNECGQQARYGKYLMTWDRTAIPFSAAAFGFAPIAYM